MKPDWKDAPEWAKWLAQDSEGGAWFWFAAQPIWDEESGEWTPCDEDDRHKQAFHRTPQGALERRP